MPEKKGKANVERVDFDLAQVSFQLALSKIDTDLKPDTVLNETDWAKRTADKMIIEFEQQCRHEYDKAAAVSKYKQQLEYLVDINAYKVIEHNPCRYLGYNSEMGNCQLILSWFFKDFEDMLSKPKMWINEKMQARLQQNVSDAVEGIAIAKTLRHVATFKHSLGIEEGIAEESNKLSAKAQVLLLHQYGFFDCEMVKNLTIQEQGALAAAIIGRGIKNTTEMVRGRLGADVTSRFDIHSKEAVEAANQIQDSMRSRKSKIRKM